MSRSSFPLTALGTLGEIWVARQLRQRGYTVELIGASSDFDLLVEGVIRVEVKSALPSAGNGGVRYQFSLRRHGLSLDEELLVLLCYHIAGAAPAAFIIPNHALPRDLTKIDITSPDPADYTGQWALYRNDWAQVSQIVAATACRKPELFRSRTEEPIPF